MTIRIRPHHLLCLLTYVGKGYNNAFINNYNLIVHRLLQGEDVSIVDGPDDICLPLLNKKKPHCLNTSVAKRDQKATIDLSKHLLCKIESNKPFTLNAKILRQMRRLFASGKIRSACIGCEWDAMCSSIASRNYDKVLIPHIV